ncbi:hypothetical protein [Paraburkholderia kururiensis]|uniref:hypothetical protein n=1 Tax=Paraburkholderia kururiensis TaxID=984307 RepID=UPI000A9A4F48|nr:hypothetical protein [Paraburkholderia kururiensis]
MSLLDLCGIIGTIVGVGAALDFSVTVQAKQFVSTWVARAASTHSGFSYAGSGFLDKIFGKKLFSPRAVTSYVVCSLISMLISYGLAVWTSPPQVRASMSIFPNKITLLAASIGFLCLAFAAAGDIASYSLTRVFVRAVDQHKNPVVTTGLIVADIVSSLGLFFLSFTIGRVFAYILVIQFSPGLFIQYSAQYFPVTLQTFFKAQPDIPGDSNDLALAHAIAAVDRQDNNSLNALSKALRQVDISENGNEYFGKYVTYSAKNEGLEFNKNPVNYLLAWVSTENILKQLMKDASRDPKQQANLKKAKDTSEIPILEKIAPNNKPGDHPVVDAVMVERRLSLANVIAIAGPANVFSAAAERTMRDSYQVMGYKLAPYVSFDPYAGLSEYIGVIQGESRVGFLGRESSHPERYKIFDLFVNPMPALPSTLRVPFSPMVASCLTSSIFFFAYLVFVALAEIRQRLFRLVGRLSPAFDWDKAIFTSLGIALSVAAVAIYFFDLILIEAWTFIFS